MNHFEIPRPYKLRAPFLAAALASFLGADAGQAIPPGWTLEGNSPAANLGFAVAAGGDYDGDSHADLLVSAASQTLTQQVEGAAYLFLGDATGPLLPADWVTAGNFPGATYGKSLAAVGDVDGDGVGDILVGAIGLEPNGDLSGAAMLFLGRASLPPATVAAWTYPGSQASAQMGWAVAGAGDVNRDGFGFSVHRCSFIKVRSGVVSEAVFLNSRGKW